jgi:hypothetical protein
MTDQQIFSKLYLLSSKPLKEELIHYLDYLLAKQFKTQEPSTKRVPKFGCAKGKFRMSDDFNEPLDHFNEIFDLYFVGTRQKRIW